MRDIRAFEPLWGEWRSVELLGEGAYGKVYLMEKTELGKAYRAAVKHISIPADERDSERLFDEGLVSDGATLCSYYRRLLDSLLNEIEVIYRLKGNSNIVSYEEHKIVPREDEFGYDIFIKMELLTSLSEQVRRNDLRLGDVLRLGEDICSALVTLQKERIVHRDIKPGNIFVNDRGDYKLGDFGVAKIIEQSVGNMSVKGTLAYMAPEVSRREEGDYRIDLYSLGLVLYRLMNGNRAPFLPPPPAPVDSAAYEQAQGRRLHGEPLPPPACADHLLSEIILKACAFAPELRWRTAEELRAALSAYRAGLTEEQLEAVVLRRIARGGDLTGRGSGARTGEPPTGGRSAGPGNDEPAPEGPTGDSETAPIPEEFSEPPPEPSEATLLKRRDGLEPDTWTDDGPTEEPTMLLTEERRRELAGQYGLPLERTKGKGGVLRFALPAAGVLAAVLAFVVLGTRGGAGEPATEPVPTLAAVARTSEPVEAVPQWREPALRDALCAALAVEPEALTSQRLAGVTELRLGEAGGELSTLADLALLPGLKVLDLSGHKLSQMDFPGDMAPLTGLNLTDCGLGDLAFLGGRPFAGLKNLALGGNEIADLAPLAGLPELSYLDLSGNPAADLSPLSGLEGLETLVAEGVPAASWEAVAHVEKVTGRPEPADEPPAVDAPAKPAPSPKPSARPQRPSTPPPVAETATPAPEPTPSVVPVTSVRLSQTSLLLDIGAMTSLLAHVEPLNATDRAVKWSSSNPAAATVDGGGNVTAVGGGTTIITASCGGCSASCAVSVS